MSAASSPSSMSSARSKTQTKREGSAPVGSKTAMAVKAARHSFHCTQMVPPVDQADRVVNAAHDEVSKITVTAGRG